MPISLHVLKSRFDSPSTGYSIFPLLTHFCPHYLGQAGLGSVHTPQHSEGEGQSCPCAPAVSRPPSSAQPQLVPLCSCNPSAAPAAHRSHCLRLLDELLSVFPPPEYDVVGYHNKSQLSSKPRDVLQMGKSICEGYAELFEHMCR